MRSSYFLAAGPNEGETESADKNSVSITITSTVPNVNVIINDDKNLVVDDKKNDKKKPELEEIKEETADIFFNPFELGENTMQKIFTRIKNKILAYFNYRKFSFKDALMLFLGLMMTVVVAKVVSWFIEHHAAKFTKKTKTKADDIFFWAISKPIGLLIFSLGLFASSWPLTNLMSQSVKMIYGRLCIALAATALAWGFFRLTEVVNYTLTKLAEKTDNNLDDLIVGVIRKTIKVVIFVVSILFIGQNILKINITTLLAGAGVIGLAVAFAAQDTIANFFGSLMIILDQPFRVGDMISVSGYKGSIEHVGFRSTRIRTLDGHIVSLPNKALANADIENIARRPFIKHTITLGLTYDTGFEKMKKAVELLHELLDSQPCMHPDLPPRIIFDSFGDFSLNIAVTVWWHHNVDGNFLDPDYGCFAKWLHQTDMDILRIFDEKGLEFAFPTTTTYLAGDGNRIPELKVVADNGK